MFLRYEVFTLRTPGDRKNRSGAMVNWPLNTMGLTAFSVACELRLRLRPMLIATKART